MSATEEPGLVVATHGRHAMVEAVDARRWRCHARGKRSEVVVGDRVRWERSGDEGVIESIEPRRNLLFRQDEWRTKSFASNLDQLLILLAVEPLFSEGQLTRALIAAADAGIAATIGLNKIDLPGAAAARQRLAPYASMGVPVVELALARQPAEARAALGARLQDRTTLVLGPSGSGKSTLVNLMVPGADAQVGEISQALGSGRHTTTTTRWYWLARGSGSSPQAPAGAANLQPNAVAEIFTGTALIDSPGFQEFGLRHIAPERLASLMPDLDAWRAGCRFHNCTHRQEPGCAVREAADQGHISAQRVRLHAELFDELSRPRW